GFAAHISALGVIPGIPVVGLRGGIKSRVKTVLREFESFLHQDWSTGVVEQVIFGDPVVLDGVVDQPTEKSNIGAGTNLQKQIRSGGSPRQPRIDDYQFGVALPLGFYDPLEATGVVFGWIPTHDQHHVCVLDVDPAIGHGPAPKSWSQT